MNNENRSYQYGRGRSSSGVQRLKSSKEASIRGASTPKMQPYGRTRRQGEPQTDTAVVPTRERSLLKRIKKEKAWEEGVQRVRHGVDRPMLIIILVLLCLGTIMVFSASYPNALASRNDSLYYIRNQILWLVIGGILMSVLVFVPYNVYKKLTPAFFLVSIGLLILVLVIGTARGVAQRWIFIGGFSIQPSEVAKIALTMMLAWYIDRHFEETSNRLNKRASLVKGIIVPGLILALVCGLVLLEKHLSGTIILGMIGICVIFLSGANVGKMALCYGIPAVAAGVGYLLTNEYALQRILTLSDESADVLNEAWQTTQGLFAIGSGGLLGVGLGESRLKYNYVSEAQNDFIFTIWCEEMGFVGAVLLIALYVAFVWRGTTIAKKAPDTYSSLVAFGITCQVGIQAFLNIMVVTAMIPNTGISLPFFSYGGSALIMLMGEMGMLLSISKHSYQKK
ncbi:MAG: cell division protein FtsW [Clostridiales bacterium]|nr:cell division protein FtsW [Clostridiales bacterium]